MPENAAQPEAPWPNDVEQGYLDGKGHLIQMHAFTPFDDRPAWCQLCWFPREHCVHQQAEGERP